MADSLTVGRQQRGAKPRPRPKGRQLDHEALSEIRALLGNRERRRDLLIEFLHLIQDRYGYLSARHLKALGDELRLPMAAVYEVATFYHHFDVVKEGETPPAPLTVRVCDSLSCAMAGADTLRAGLESGLDPAKVRVLHAPCMGRCQSAPVCVVGQRHVDNADAERVIQIVKSGADRHAIVPSYKGLETYRAEGGYALLGACLSGQRKPEELIDILSNAGLRGLGGAGFPTGRKWSIVRAYPGPRLMTINGDEGEPGTFKDRYFLESDPHRMLEGALIAAWAVGAEACYIYLRDEYPAARQILTREIAALERAGLTKHCQFHLRRGAGAYICGEESAMIESIEGKRGYPRHRPPYIAEVGLFGRPTLNHNIETLWWVRDIVQNGAEWFAVQGKNGSKGLRSYSVSGRVKNPGVIITAAGSTARDLIEACGGMLDGHSFKGYLPGGPSGGILPASLGDLPLDFGTLEKYGCFVGSHAVVILSDQDNIKDVALNLLQFFEDESCGQCTPCRVGCEKAVKLMSNGPWPESLLLELGQGMSDASICGLGQAAPNPIRSALAHFREDVL
jgi:NADH:ubiquinone oxidoreductase subunit F (NADH-binding)/NADH:ubiquinone oxidoreductase subunit E